MTLPSFSPDAGGVLGTAMEAEAAGLHGIFCFDHQFPLGHPERPSLSIYPVLAAVAAVTDRITIGSLVARIGLLPDEVVAASIESLHAMVGDRLIAGLGTGDEESEPEHARYGIPYLGAAARIDSLEQVAGRLCGQGIECWVGAGRDVTNEVAKRCHATLNFWGARPERLRRAAANLGVAVSWGGPLPDSAEEAAATLIALGEAGATWAVWGWPSSLDLVVQAAGLARIELAG